MVLAQTLKLVAGRLMFPGFSWRSPGPSSAGLGSITPAPKVSPLGREAGKEVREGTS